MTFKKEGSERLVRWYAKCNYYGTEVRREGDRLLPIEVGGTLVGCPRGWLQEDEWLALFMKAAPRFRFSNDRLVLSVDGKKLELHERNDG
jgi:hypothetical protein